MIKMIKNKLSPSPQDPRHLGQTHAFDATAASMSSPWRLRRHMPQKDTGIRPRPQPSAVHCRGEEGTWGRGVSHQ